MDNKIPESAFLKEIQSTSSDVDVGVFANLGCYLRNLSSHEPIVSLLDTLREIYIWNVFEFYSDKHLLWEGYLVALADQPWNNHTESVFNKLLLGTLALASYYLTLTS